MKLIVGRTYIVRDSRKGTYLGQCLFFDGEFARFQIIKGEATYLTQENAVAGDVVSARLGIATFEGPLTRKGKTSHEQ